MNKVMSRSLFKYCNDNLHNIGIGKLKKTPSLESLNIDYSFGTLDDKFCYFNDKDKEILIDKVKFELNVHLFRDSYPGAKTKTKNAEDQRNEKTGALKVSHDYVLLNSLGSLCLNQLITESHLLSSLGNFICASEIKTIEHKHIIMVENLEVMANLPLLNIPEELKSALWLYRGDQQKHKKTDTADCFFKRFKKTNQLICFSDFDPKGLEIALTCGAVQWLTLAQKKDINIKLRGDEFEWFKQQNAKKYLNKNITLTDEIEELFNTMNNHQKSLKQEHIVAHSLTLRLYPLQ
jgi:hypothetical protein